MYKKIVFAILLSFVLVFSSTVSVNASSLPFPSVATVPDAIENGNTYVVVYSNIAKQYELWVAGNFYYYPEESMITTYSWLVNRTATSRYLVVNGKWVYDSYYSGFTVSDDNKNQILLSGRDITYWQSKDVFFSKIETLLTLRPILAETQTGGTLSQVIGLVPLLLVLAVGFLGLRKALQVLLTVLRKA